MEKYVVFFNTASAISAMPRSKRRNIVHQKADEYIRSLRGVMEQFDTFEDLFNYLKIFHKNMPFDKTRAPKEFLQRLETMQLSSIAGFQVSMHCDLRSFFYPDAPERNWLKGLYVTCVRGELDFAARRRQKSLLSQKPTQ